MSDHTPGMLESVAAVHKFVQAGNATLTIKSKKTGTRFTFKFVRPEAEPGKDRPTWVRLLNGPDNEGDYQFLGTIWEHNELEYYHGKKSPISSEAPSALALRWLVHALGTDKSFDQCEVWHEGRCGRCGRKLTVPESIESGFGPECAQLI